MEIILTGGGGMREKLKNFFEKDGFYFILFICVCIVAIAAVAASRGNLNKAKNETEGEGEDFIILEDEVEDEESIEIANIEENKVEETEAVEEEEEVEMEETEDMEEEAQEVANIDEEMVIVEDEDEYEEEQIEEPSSSFEGDSGVGEMAAPVIGKIGTDYTEDSLIYSETLDKWTSHKGIDIIAPEGTAVGAALSGTVQEVYEDPLWGMVVVLSHGDNLLTKYASLSEDGLIEEGATVNKGDIIGRVGKTAAVEMLMEPHVHFEVIEDGISINPNIYLPSFMYSN